jgi:deoxycytidine triphosphate deaminase
VLLSDCDLRAEIDAGRLGIEPFDEKLLQPSSIDVRLDRFFRVFVNTKYTHIDPSLQQDELTSLVEPDGDEPFVLHPGEFVLGSTFEQITLPDDLAGRLEGKALAVDTPIPTSQGWRTMGELRLGDEVFGADGRTHRVIAATEVMVGRTCYEVLFSDGQSIVADSSHLWLTTTTSARKHGGCAAVRTTAELAGSLRAQTEYNHHVALAGAVRYPEQPLPIDPYVLGVWLGDGAGVCAEITCGAGDEQMLDEIQGAGYCVRDVGGRRFRIGGLARGHIGRRRDIAPGRFLPDESLSNVLRGLDLLGNKHVPELYLRSSVPQRLALLQGLMDSNGYVDTRGRCEFVNIRENLADAVLELAASLGLRPVKRKKEMSFRGVDHGVAFQVKFTPHVNVFRLERKTARLKDGAVQRSRAVIDVRRVPTRPVRCIEVDAVDGLFLAGPTFIPTHNSSLGRLGLLTHSTAGFIDPGFTGHITLELSNVANLPITLWPGMKIGQLCLFRLSSPAQHPYGSAGVGSRYQGQRGPTPSRAYLNFQRIDTRR